MAVDCVDAQHELLSDGGIAETACDEREHFALAFGQGLRQRSGLPALPWAGVKRTGDRGSGAARVAAPGMVRVAGKGDQPRIGYEGGDLATVRRGPCDLRSGGSPRLASGGVQGPHGRRARTSA